MKAQKVQAQRVQIQHVQKVPRNVAPWWYSKLTLGFFGCASFAYVASVSGIYAMAATLAVGGASGSYLTHRVMKRPEPDPPGEVAADDLGIDPYAGGLHEEAA